MTTTKTVILSHHELLELIAVVKTIKSAAIQQKNMAEVKLMNELMHKLLDFTVDIDRTTVQLDRMSRFSLWLCMEKYIEFCAETKQHTEYAVAVTIATKLSG
jgi:hypothetical protein